MHDVIKLITTLITVIAITACGSTAKQPASTSESIANTTQNQERLESENPDVHEAIHREVHDSKHTLAHTAPHTEPHTSKHTEKHQHPNAKVGDYLKVVTWNVEHLAYPIDKGCRPRTPVELAELQTYARGLDADIVALQEVGSKSAVHLLFPAEEWTVIMSGRPNSPSYDCRGNGFKSTQQKVAFAVKKPLNIFGVKSLVDLSLGRIGLRYGLEIKVETSHGLTDILNVHLKSGCFVDDYYDKDSHACRLIKRQVPVLQNWVIEQNNSNTPYVILGDFNHRISIPYNRMTRKLRGTDDDLSIATKELVGCHPRYPVPIDHIVVGNMDDAMAKQTAKVYAFKDMRENAMLSDHCAVAVTL